MYTNLYSDRISGWRDDREACTAFSFLFSFPVLASASCDFPYFSLCVFGPKYIAADLQLLPGRIFLVGTSFVSISLRKAQID